MRYKNYLTLLLLLGVPVQGMAASADAKAQLLMQQVAAAARRTHSLSAVLTMQIQTNGKTILLQSGKIHLQKPNLARIELPTAFGAPNYGTINSDGNRVWERAANNNMPDGFEYQNVPAERQGKNIQFYFALPVAFFFNSAASLTTMYAADKVSDIHYVGQRVVKGIAYDVVEQDVLQPSPYTVRLYVSSSKQLCRVETDMPGSADMPQHSFDEATLSQVNINHPVPLSTFSFTPTGQIASDAAPNTHSGLPLVGTLAADFKLRTLSGKTITLADALQGKKAIYLDFWFCDCMVCRHEFPVLQKLYTVSKAQGLEIYAVNAFDDAAKVRRFKSQMDMLKSATFPIMLTGSGDPSGMVKQYGVDAYPSGILVGADGRVLFTSIGYQDKPGLSDLKVALAKAGITLH